MDKNSKNAYVASLLDPEAKAGLPPHEERALARLREAGERVIALEKDARSIEEELAKVKLAVVTARGQANAHAETLWAEHLVRAKAGSVEPIKPEPPGEPRTGALADRDEPPQHGL